MEQKKVGLIFGLAPLAALVNAVIMSILSGVFWSISFLKQIPDGFKFSSAKQLQGLDISIPWYYDMPFIVLSMLLLFSWIEYKFKIPPGELSLKAIIYKYFYGVFFTMFLGFFTKIIILYLFLN